MILDLAYYGDPFLRMKAEPVEEITKEIQQLARDMVETMQALSGIGLAATQVRQLVRIFVSNVAGEDEEGEVIYGDPVVYINPELSNPGEVLVERSEGCLSVPKLYLPVIRPLTITIEALDINGNRFSKNCYGYHARNVMHENDHLNGVLFFDRLKGKRRNEIEPALRQIKMRYSK